jgi:hypothetical protein
VFDYLHQLKSLAIINSHELKSTATNPFPLGAHSPKISHSMLQTQHFQCKVERLSQKNLDEAQNGKNIKSRTVLSLKMIKGWTPYCNSKSTSHIS